MTAAGFVPGCGADCPCQVPRSFGQNRTIFSTGRVDQIEEVLPSTRYLRHAGRPLVWRRLFVRAEFLRDVTYVTWPEACGR